MVVIICMILIVLCVAISWSMYNLKEFDRTNKVKIVGIIFLFIAIVTWIVISISKMDVEYPDDSIEQTNTYVIMLEYTSINSLLILPYLTKKIYKIKSGEIEKEKFTRIITIFVILTIILCVYECNSIYDSQVNIVNKYNELVESEN